MADVPKWLRDVPVPTDEQFAELDRARSARAQEDDRAVAAMLARQALGLSGNS